MSAYNSFWYDMSERVYQLNCLEAYRKKVHSIDQAINITVAVFSCSSVIAWTSNWLPPAVCAFGIVALQILSIVSPQFKLNEHFTALTFMIPDVNDNLAAMEDFWLVIDTKNDQEIITKRNEFNKQYRLLDEKYLLNLSPNFSKKLCEKAHEERVRYLDEHFLLCVQEEVRS